MIGVAPRRVYVLALLALLGWTVALAASMVWEMKLLREQIVALGRTQAMAAFDRDLSYRRWNAEVGGVYVRADKVAPNPYLRVEHRDLETVAGPLTLVNPAYMTHFVHDLAAKTTGIVSHLTSLDPIRPENRPLPWESVALRGFLTGESEYATVQTAPNGERVLRFMRPLVVDVSCLTCHAHQGYAVGDVRGGISLSVPLAPIAAILAPTRWAIFAGHGIVWGGGILGIVLGAVGVLRMGRSLDQARERAESADRAKSRFLATMSHELRTPLNSVLGFSQLMEQKLFGPVGNEHYEGYVRDIRRSGEHLLALINDVLDLSKIEAGRLSLDEQVMSLAEAVKDVFSLMRDQARRAGVRLDHDIQPNVPALIADPRAVRQILLNLLGNAIRFTPAGGRVLVSINLDNRGRQMLTVSDTGVGIPENEVGQIFEPFQQGHATRRHGERGTGLGLPLVRAIIKLHGGTISVHSRVDIGTTVTLRFPVRRTSRVRGVTAVTDAAAYNALSSKEKEGRGGKDGDGGTDDSVSASSMSP